MLMPSTPFAPPQVVSRRFASSNSAFLQVSSIFVAGSIPGRSTDKGPSQTDYFWLGPFLRQRHVDARTPDVASTVDTSSTDR